MRSTVRSCLAAATLLTTALPLLAADKVTTANGIVEGTTEASGVRAFKGIPFAAPPVGDLRWKPPQPVKNWDGVRAATAFGPRCMQRRVFSDMVFYWRSGWNGAVLLGVRHGAYCLGCCWMLMLLLFVGGVMNLLWIVALTVNHRLTVFGFFAHPELTKESPHHASGNQGLLDQAAALEWVRQNIAAFGGDPAKVTIAGESAGSLSVSAQMASPLSRGLIAGAIGESGALINPTLGPVSLEEAEQNGVKFATAVGAATLAALRAMPADQLLEATARQGLPRFGATVDGYFLPKLPAEIFAAGEQAHVPLLVGWNSEENNARAVLGADPATPENYAKALDRLYKERAGDVLELYAATTNDEVTQAATDLATDRFIGFSTWKWSDLHSRTGGKPVYRYLYARPRPPMNPSTNPDAPAPPPPARGAVHSAEIEYAMGNLSTNKVFAWTPDDYKVSELMQGYFANFIKTGDPNGSGLPAWPAANHGDVVQVMHIDVQSRAEPERHRDRYVFLDRIYK